MIDPLISMGGAFLVESPDTIGALPFPAVVAPTLVTITSPSALSAIGVPWEVL